MADLISRLKLESGEFDSKIKRAAQGIQRMAEECHNAGGILNQLEDENRAYIQSLGSMATVATTAKGKLAELTAAFTDIRSLYNALSDEEKQGEVGQELNKQLEIMKGRIIAAKTELSDINKELGNTGKQSQETGGFLDKLKDRFVVNIDAMKLFDLGLKAIGSALDVAKDAFFASEANIDEWGRSTRTAGDLYDGFLYSINTGDISGYLSRIDEIVSAAKEAYNELDRLSTQKAINNAASQGQRVENERMRTMLRTGRYIAPADGRASTPGLKEGDKLSKKQLAAIAKQLGYGQEKLNKFIRDDIKQAGKAIDALYKEEAKKLGLNLADFRKGTSNMSEFDKRMSGYRQYTAYNKKYGVVDMQGYFHAPANNPYQQYAAWGVFQDDGETFTAINNLINERAGYQSQLYSNAASNYRAINRGTGGGRSGGRGGGKAYEPKTKVIDMKPMEGLGMPDIYDRWGNKIEMPKPQVLTPDQRMRNEILAQGQGLLSGISPLTFPEQSAETQAFIKRKANQVDREASYEELGKKFDDSSKTWADMNSNLNNIVAGVESLGIEVPSGFKKMIGITQTVSTILSGITSVLWLINTSNWADTVIPFHKGGVVRAATGTVVPGNYGFDAVPALLTSGETVLTRAQAGNIASQLQQGSRSAGTPQARVSGEDIYITLTNYMQRRGYGEVVMSH